MAVIATLSKGYDLDYIWRQVDRGLAPRTRAGYYIQARRETGGEPPGRWWGRSAQALGLEPRPDRLNANRMTCCSANARPPAAPR